MSRFDPDSSILAGMDTTVLQQRLQAAQQAYLDLSTGAKGETFSYTMADGAKSVTYTRANMADLVQAIRLMQSQLGLVHNPRRALGVSF